MWKQSRSERGQALVLFAAGLAGFLGLVGLSIDVGHMLYMRTEMQKTADAAALAGASQLPGSKPNAETVALDYAGKNNATATVAVTFPQNNRIKVEATRHVSFAFLKVLGMDGTDVSAHAVVEADSEVITGFNTDNVAPFTIWGGSRSAEVHPGDAACELHVCVGQSYTFLDTGWTNSVYKPAAPDWSTTVKGNDYKGDINHGQGGELVYVGDELTVNSKGGLGNVSAPTVGEILVIPIITKAKGNPIMQLTVGAWAIVEVQPGCKKQHCEGKVLAPLTTNVPGGWATGGGSEPPTGLQYVSYTGRMVE